MRKEVAFPIAAGLILGGIYFDKINNRSGCEDGVFFKDGIAICQVEDGWRIQDRDNKEIYLDKEELCNPDYIVSIRKKNITYYTWEGNNDFSMKTVNLETGKIDLVIGNLTPIYRFTGCSK